MSTESTALANPLGSVRTDDLGPNLVSELGTVRVWLTVAQDRAGVDTGLIGAYVMLPNSKLLAALVTLHKTHNGWAPRTIKLLEE